MKAFLYFLVCILVVASRVARFACLPWWRCRVSGFSLAPRVAEARPTGPRLFLRAVPRSSILRGAASGLHDVPHVSTSPPAWNSFGDRVRMKLLHGDFDAQAKTGRPRLIEGEDSDGDGVANGREIAVGTLPGDANDVWLGCGAPTTSPGATAIVASAPETSVAADYDFVRAFGRVLTLAIASLADLRRETRFSRTIKDAPGRLFEEFTTR